MSDAERGTEGTPGGPARPRRWLRRTSRAAGTAMVLSAALGIAAWMWMSSAAFEHSLRKRLIAGVEEATGGRAEVDRLHWNLLGLWAEADGLTIHGLEPAGVAPYAHVDSMRAQLSILDLFTVGAPTKVRLREAEVVRPSFHLIIAEDGSTNQPQPRHLQRLNKPVMETLFDAQVGDLVVKQGVVHIEKRSALSRREQVLPFDFEANDLAIRLRWMDAPRRVDPRNADANGSYRLELGTNDLRFVQGKVRAVPARIDVALLLFRDGVQLDSFRMSALGRTLSMRGKLTSFAHPVWEAEGDGQLDLRMLESTTGFAFAREGIVSLAARGTGQGGTFQASGTLSGAAVHYQDPVVDARTTELTARFHMDAKQLFVTDIHTRLAQGGVVDGDFRYDNWLDSTPLPAVQAALRRAHQTWNLPAGVVHGTLKDISLDTLMLMLASPQFRKLGFDAIVSGPAQATWTGLGTDLAIGGQLGLRPSAQAVAGEAPVHGLIDGVFHAEAGSVQVTSMDVQLPRSSLVGKGSLGVVPIERTSAMTLDFRSSDLSEFDTALNALQFHQGSRKASAALPFAVKGQAEFHGTLGSSWLTPRLEGHATASKIDLQIPSSSADPNAPLRFMSWDSIDAEGMYTPASIAIHRGVLKRDGASLSLQGEIDSGDPHYDTSKTETEFGMDSTLRLRADAQQYPLAELLKLAGMDAPIDGRLNAHVDLQGELRALNGSGNVEVSQAKAYGETIGHVVAAGTISGHQIKISSLSAEQSGGQLTARGSYDMEQERFQVDARGTAIDLASLHAMKAPVSAVEGRLGFTLAGEGTLHDPQLQAQATLSRIKVAGEPVADVELRATSRQHAVVYDISSHQTAGQLSAHGTTSLDANYDTKASVQVAGFDIGALLKLMKVTGISGQSDIEGSATISGPLAHLEKLNGEASLQQVAAVLQGVHLQSKGAVRARLSSGVVKLDPVEVTGEDTDLSVGGTLAVLGTQQLDVNAKGAVNLRLAGSLDPDLIASGVTSFEMEAHGPLSNPLLKGSVRFENASMALQDFPNGLSQIKGTLEFVQNRLEVRSLTAQSGGGQLSVGGYIGFQRGLYADLTATGKSIRVRYPQGVSSLADASLRLQGPQNNLLLNGNVVVTRFAINADLDMAAFAAQAPSVQTLLSPDAPSNHLRLDVHLTSAPQLNFQNAYAKLAGDVDLRLRGTLAAPSLLGRISLTDGSTSLGGTKYELQRGDIYFNNPVRIQPNIDLDATARVEDYDITLGLHGTPDKLKVTYRSEPPLPEADVIALLALGRTQNETSAYAQQQQQAGDNPTTDALLGGALNATVSNRVQKLFGSGAIKVDPNFIGSLGNSTARVTVVEQIGKNLTFTYASNVNTTTQQLIQAEIAINRHVSLLVTQDESGIFSMVVKARRRFR